MLPLSCFLQQRGDRFFLCAEVEKSWARDFDWVTQRPDVELSDNVRRELARIHLPLFGERHERVALIVAKLWVWARADLNRVQVGIRQDLRDGLAELLLEFLVQHR